MVISYVYHLCMLVRIFNDFLYLVIIVPSLLLQAEVRQAVCAMYNQPIEQTQVKEEREGRLRHKYDFLLT